MIEGKSAAVVLVRLYPRARLPEASSAALPIQRPRFALPGSGAYVACSVVVMTPPGLVRESSKYLGAAR